MQFTSAQQIADHKWIGNHFADAEAIKSATRFALQKETTKEDAVIALNAVGVGAMGLDADCTLENIDEILEGERAEWNAFYTKDQL